MRSWFCTLLVKKIGSFYWADPRAISNSYSPSKVAKEWRNIPFGLVRFLSPFINKRDSRFQQQNFNRQNLRSIISGLAQSQLPANRWQMNKNLLQTLEEWENCVQTVLTSISGVNERMQKLNGSCMGWRISKSTNFLCHQPEPSIVSIILGILEYK